MLARVVILAGPSGAGKSRLAARLAGADWPVVRLDDFYRDGDDPGLPRVHLPGGVPVVDWDDPAAWCHQEALEALRTLCREGEVEVPVYELGRDRRTGTHRLVLDGAPLVVAEGLFADRLVVDCREAGILAVALCVVNPALLTFLRRLVRDLREARKPPWLLLRRGIALWRAEPAVVARAERAGCLVVRPAEAERLVRDLVEA